MRKRDRDPQTVKLNKDTKLVQKLEVWKTKRRSQSDNICIKIWQFLHQKLTIFPSKFDNIFFKIWQYLFQYLTIFDNIVFAGKARYTRLVAKMETFSSNKPRHRWQKTNDRSLFVYAASTTFPNFDYFNSCSIHWT